MVTVKPFGKIADGTEVDLISIKNNNGSIFEVSNYGACITSIKIKMTDGSLRDVVLGYETPAEYEADKDNYFGATIGRIANRINACDDTGKPGFILNGKTYYLADTSGNGASLHGGVVGFNQKVFSYKTGENCVEFKYTSPDGEENYPGNLELTVKFEFDDNNVLAISYDAVSDSDTICNPTNHSYFNLAGHNSGVNLKHKVYIDSDRINELLQNIVTGKILDVAGTAYDFNEPHEIGERIENSHYQLVDSKGYDCNYILKPNPKKEIRQVAWAESPAGDLRLNVLTDAEGIQLYTGNFLDGRKGKGGAIYNFRNALCLETQILPNAINMPHFPTSSVIKAGEHFTSKTIYAFEVK